MNQVLNFFSILSDETRIRILLLLQENELCVCQLMKALEMSQPRISSQLSTLKIAGLVEGRREGKWIYYRISDGINENMKSIFEITKSWLKNDKLYQIDKECIKECLDLQKKNGKCDPEVLKAVRENTKLKHLNDSNVLNTD